jgi:hypothetical protein
VSNVVSFSGLSILDCQCSFLKHVFMIHRMYCKSHGKGGRRGRDRMVVGFTTTYAISAYQH